METPKYTKRKREGNPQNENPENLIQLGAKGRRLGLQTGDSHENSGGSSTMETSNLEGGGGGEREPISEGSRQNTSFTVLPYNRQSTEEEVIQQGSAKHKEVEILGNSNFKSTFD